MLLCLQASEVLQLLSVSCVHRCVQWTRSGCSTSSPDCGMLM